MSNSPSFVKKAVGQQRKPPIDEEDSTSIESTPVLETSGDFQERRRQRGGFFVEWQLERRNPRLDRRRPT